MLEEIYVVAFVDENGEFQWIYIDPKPYYPTQQEAEEIRQKLIERNEIITETNCIVKKLYRIIEDM